MFRAVLLSIISFFHYTHSNGVCHTGLLTACEQDQDGTGLVLLQQLFASCQQICMYCCVYSEKLLMMDRGTDRNMYSFSPNINLRN
jgi:pyruvate formate-lyase activating enzyme-like uncharacterized protein